MYICRPLFPKVMGWERRQRNPHRGVEQLVARRAHNPKVAGSSPVPATSSPMHESASGFHLRLCRAQAFGSKAQMKDLTRAVCDGLGVKPPLWTRATAGGATLSPLLQARCTRCTGLFICACADCVLQALDSPLLFEGLSASKSASSKGLWLTKLM